MTFQLLKASLPPFLSLLRLHGLEGIEGEPPISELGTGGFTGQSSYYLFSTNDVARHHVDLGDTEERYYIPQVLWTRRALGANSAES